jgi:hypothetical protein
MSKHARKKNRKPAKLAMEIKGVVERQNVVTALRERWKLKHSGPTDRLIRFIRFVWMRELVAPDRYKLHAGLLGAATRDGYIAFDGSKLKVTSIGEAVLNADRRTG